MAAQVKHRSSSGGRQFNRKSAGKSKKTHAGDLDAEAPISKKSSSEIWTPTLLTAFKALLTARLTAAIWSHITDCDETFNYWEPMHYLLHGKGLQTWEYSPVYAIRSYAFIWLYAWPVKLYMLFSQGNKVFEFYFVRILLALFSAGVEVFLYRAVRRHYGTHPARLLLCFLVFGSGMFISTTAVLPSSFSMYLTMLALAGWLTKHYSLAIFGIAASAIIGWPFAGALGVPIAYDIIVRQRRVWFFIQWAVISAVVCLVPLVWIDTHYYGKLVITPLNILLYNVFSEHGPDIYGVEPWSFYFINGFLNFNVVFILSIVSIPLVLLIQVFVKPNRKELPVWLCLGPLFIWMVIFFTRPHKEERFLFPVYPFVCLAAAVTLDKLQRLLHWLVWSRSTQVYTTTTGWLSLVFCIVYIALSMSRSVALYKGYHAPLDVYGELNRLTSEVREHDLPPGGSVNVCVGKEWYRFPSNFFLPSDRWKFQFVKSEFRGQLPQPYSTGEDGTRVIPPNMNDLNTEETSTYIDVSRCHFMVDLDLLEEKPDEPRYSVKTEWTVVSSAPFLDNQRSHKLFRAFYVPFLSEENCHYVSYNILQAAKHKIIKPASPSPY